MHVLQRSCCAHMLLHVPQHTCPRMSAQGQPASQPNSDQTQTQSWRLTLRELVKTLRRFGSCLRAVVMCRTTVPSVCRSSLLLLLTLTRLQQRGEAMVRSTSEGEGRGEGIKWRSYVGCLNIVNRAAFAVSITTCSPYKRPQDRTGWL